MTMPQMNSDVRPELAKHIGQGIAPNGISVLACNRSNRAVLAGIVRQRDALGDAAAKNLGGIEARCVRDSPV